MVNSGKRATSILSTHKYLRIVYYLSAAIGISPFLLESDHYLISYSLGILSIISVTLLGYSISIINYSSFYELSMDEELVISMEKVLVTCVLSTHSILFFISVGTSRWRVRPIRQIIATLEEVDSMLEQRLREEYYFQDFLCFFLNVLLIAWQAYIYNSFAYRFFSIVITINVWLTASQFSVLARLISDRLRNACESLNELKKTIELPHQEEKVGMLSSAHGKLCDASEALQATFGLLITVLTIISFMGLTVVTFYLYNSPNLHNIFDIRFSLFDAPDRPPVENILWMIYTLTICWIIVASSSDLTEKVSFFSPSIVY